MPNKKQTLADLRGYFAGYIRNDPRRPSPNKIDLYIDVDGVLFGLYGGCFQLRPNVKGFLNWCTNHFNCYWLTYWPADRVEDMLRLIYCSDLAVFIPHTRWMERAHHKAGAINYSRPFYWIDDDPNDEEMQILSEHGAKHRFIAVNPKGRDGLWVVQRRLNRILELEGEKANAGQ